MTFYGLVAGAAFASGGLVTARQLAQGRRAIVALGMGIGAELLGLALLVVLFAAAAAGVSCNRP